MAKKSADKRKASKRTAKKAPSRRLMLKFRVRLLRRMPKSMVWQRIKDTVAYGVVPDDIELISMDWSHGQGKRFTPGSTIDGDDLGELEKFYAVLTKMDEGSVRVERPD